MQRRGQSKPFANPAAGPGGDGRGVTDQSYLERLMSSTQFPSAIKEFVHPGKEPSELLMRCVFQDERQANAAVLYLAKCEEFKLERHKKLLLHKLAATTSIKGLARRELLQAVTGIIAPQLFGERGEREKGRGGGS